jgi:hypothetical protein
MVTTVFISSTSRDLLDHRAAVAKALLDAGYHPVDMANFMARPEGAATACLKEVAESDLFLGIYAWRYGYIPEGAEVSITEQEFIEAKRLSKPCFIFMVDESYPWPEEYKEGEPGARLLRDFKARLDSQLVRTTFTTPDDLAKRVLASLQRYKPTNTTQERTMSDESKKQTQIGGVNFSGISGSSINVGNIDASVKAGGNIVGGNMIVGGPQAETDPESPQAKLLAAFTEWKQQVEAKIEARPDLDAEGKSYVKEDFKQKAKDLEAELDKGAEAKANRLEMLFNMMSNMAPDILEVTAKTLQNPFAGVGLVLEKINNRIKLEQKAKAEQ